MTKGEAIVDIMNATGYDIAIPGNHEFDYVFFQDETGEGVYGAMQAAVDGARGEGADYVVVMGHMGDEAEVILWTYADVIAHTSGIDAWLDGHSHDAEQVVMKNALGQPVYRSACGSRNENIGVLTIRVDGTIRTELFKWSSSLSAPRLLGLKNPETEAVARAGELLDERMSATIASTEAALVINEPGGKLRDGKPVRLIQNTQTNLARSVRGRLSGSI